MTPEATASKTSASSCSTGESSPYGALTDLPSSHQPLTRERLCLARMASAAIPLVRGGVQIPGAPPGTYRDGGVSDYHLDLDFGPGHGIATGRLAEPAQPL